MNDPDSAIHWVNWTILLVDDEAPVLRTIRLQLLQGFPHARILTSQNGQEALTMLAHENVDLVVTDHRMPTMDGLEFIQRALKVSPSTARVLLTGHADVGVIEEYVNTGQLNAFFTKPLDRPAFIAKLASLLQERRGEIDRKQAFARALYLSGIPQRTAPFVSSLGDERA